MRRQLLLVVAVAALVALAGCSAVPGLDGTSPESPNTENLEDYPSGFSADGVTDAEAATSAHKSAVLEESSWTATYQTSVAAEGQSQDIEDIRYVDHTESLELNIVNTPFGTQSVYKVDEEGWQKQEAMNQTAYSYGAVGYNSTDAVHTPMLTSFLTNVEYEQSDVTEEDGETHITYQATGLTDGSELAPQGENASELEDVSASLTVTEEGAITNYEFGATAITENQPDTTLSIDLEFTDLGETSVEDPSWLDEAKETASENAPGPENGNETPTENETTTDES